MKKEKILEIAFKHLSQPYIYPAHIICRDYGITSFKFRQIQQTDVWDEAKRIVQDLADKGMEQKDKQWVENHLNKIQEWQDRNYSTANAETSLAIRMNLLLHKAMDALESSEEDALLENLRVYANPLTSLAKAVTTIHSHANQAQADALSLDKLLEVFEKGTEENSENAEQN